MSRDCGELDSKLSRRSVLQATGYFALTPWALVAGSPMTDIQDQPALIQVPADPAKWPKWRRDLVAWRAAARATYDGSEYDKPAFAWTPTCYCCTKIMVWDETFLNHATGEYHVDAIVRDGIHRFGGYDAIVLWHAYPRIGFDDRNQFDYYNELPGGLPGLRKVVERFHAHNMRVFIDYNPWDTGTRRTGLTDAQACADLVKAINGDGIFLDTLGEGAEAMRAAADAAKPGIALESELAMPISAIPTNHLSWAQWFDSDAAPGVLRNRWLEQRHMMHFIRRWDTSHVGEIQLAWMNGAGMLVWENIFGSWNGWSARDQATLRSMLPVQRHFTRHFTHGEWTPMVSTAVKGLYASEWKLDGVRLWTLANRQAASASGSLMDVQLGVGERLFDPFTGQELSSAKGEIAGNEIAGLLAVPAGRLTPELEAYLVARSKHISAKLARVHVPAPRLSGTEHRRPRQVLEAPPGMLEVGAGSRIVVTKFRQRECGERGYAPVGGPRELHAEFAERRTIEFGRFALMRHGVTNAEFVDFLEATGYYPKRDENFLKHFDQQHPKSGEEGLPVRYVNLEDAHAYANWKGWRLPSDADWQVAMETEPALVTQNPLWNWTDSEYSDGHTRYCILKGGAAWRAEGSAWYADSGVHSPDFAAKFIQIWAGLDRCATIGFRCAVSLA